MDLGLGFRPSHNAAYSDGNKPFSESQLFTTNVFRAAMVWAGDNRGEVQLEVVLFDNGNAVKIEPGMFKTYGDLPLHSRGGNSKSRLLPLYRHDIMVKPGGSSELTASYYLESFLPNPQQELNRRAQAEGARSGFTFDEARNKGKSRESSTTTLKGLEGSKVASRESLNCTIPAALSGTNHDLRTEEDVVHPDGFWKYQGEDESEWFEGYRNPELKALRRELGKERTSSQA